MFSEEQYEDVGVIQSGFKDSINCMQFSPDGKWLAAGGDDGRLVIVDIQSEGFSEDTIMAAAPVTAVAWNPYHWDTLFVGYVSGEIMECRVSSDDQVCLVLLLRDTQF